MAQSYSFGRARSCFAGHVYVFVTLEPYFVPLCLASAPWLKRGLPPTCAPPSWAISRREVYPPPVRSMCLVLSPALQQPERLPAAHTAALPEAPELLAYKPRDRWPARLSVPRRPAHMTRPSLLTVHPGQAASLRQDCPIGTAPQTAAARPRPARSSALPRRQSAAAQPRRRRARAAPPCSEIGTLTCAAGRRRAHRARAAASSRQDELTRACMSYPTLPYPVRTSS
jgi:hypothetical protein